MANGKTIVDGVLYLAATHAGGDAERVHVVMSEEGGHSIHVYLVDELEKVFTESDVEFMEALGFFYTSFDEDAYAECAYSFFWLPL